VYFRKENKEFQGNLLKLEQIENLNLESRVFHKIVDFEDFFKKFDKIKTKNG